MHLEKPWNPENRHIFVKCIELQHAVYGLNMRQRLPNGFNYRLRHTPSDRTNSRRYSYDKINPVSLVMDWTCETVDIVGCVRYRLAGGVR